ncbi:MAG: nodulation protein NfeD [Actinobacteria bacterium]|nr:nodulation protein NfeD [Actinomycetota bacterium]
MIKRFTNLKIKNIARFFLALSAFLMFFYFIFQPLQLFADYNSFTDKPKSSSYEYETFGQGNETAGIITEINRFHVCKIEGIIDPVISNFISKSIDQAQDEQAALIILLDTPGGLDTSMREIALKIINTPVPVIAFVYPEGARAASAGVFIVYASDIALMAPNSSIGAAHPVMLGSDQGATEEQMEKIVNDSVSFIKNLAFLNNRNADWAEKSIRESASITSSEAIEMNVINHIASDTENLINIIDRTTLEKQNQVFILSVIQHSVKTVEMSIFEKFLHIIINPNIAYIFFTLGLLGIIYEFSQPGLGISGALGVLLIILGLYSFSVLPINYTGIALIILAVILFILDLKLALGGVLSITGVASMIIGSFMLIDTAAPYLQIAKSLIIGLSVAISVFLIIAIRAVYAAQRKKPVTGTIAMIESTGEAIEDLNPYGYIKTHGEIWKAESFDGKIIKKGSKVSVLKSQGLLLTVKRSEEINETSEKSSQSAK